MGAPRHSLDDPDYAAFAWARYRRVLRWMAGIAALVSVIAAGLIGWWLGELRLHVAIATMLGTFCTIMTGAALMGLMFLSSGRGRDEEVIDPLRDEIDLD